MRAAVFNYKRSLAIFFSNVYLNKLYFHMIQSYYLRKKYQIYFSIYKKNQAIWNIEQRNYSPQKVYVKKSHFYKNSRHPYFHFKRVTLQNLYTQKLNKKCRIIYYLSSRRTKNLPPYIYFTLNILFLHHLNLYILRVLIVLHLFHLVLHVVQ